MVHTHTHRILLIYISSYDASFKTFWKKFPFFRLWVRGSFTIVITDLVIGMDVNIYINIFEIDI